MWICQSFEWRNGRGWLHSYAECNQVTWKWSSNAGQVPEIASLGPSGRRYSVTPAMMQFEDFPDSSSCWITLLTRCNPCILLSSLSCRTKSTFEYEFMSMPSSFLPIAPSLARVFAPSLRCQAQKSSLPTLRRTFATPTEQPRLRLGSVAPNFKAKTTQGDIDFHEWLGDKWGILFSHPADFTPVCTTELGAFARMKGEFEKRNVKMIGLVRTKDI